MGNRVSFFLISAIVLFFCAQATVTAQGQNSVVFGPETFTRNAGEPQVVTRNFSVQDSSQPYTLIIRSGQNGVGIVSSAVITLNGAAMAAPSDFNKQTGLIIKPARLQQDNTLSVKISGQPGSFLTVTVKQGVAPTQLTIIDSLTDPLLLKVETADGKVIDYFGNRDAEGLPTSIYAARIQSANGDVTIFYFDEQSRLSRVVAPNGVFFDVTWVSDTSAAVTAIAPDGSQIDIPVDLTTQTTGIPTFSTMTPGTLTAPTARAGSFSPALTAQALIINQGEATSLVTVRQCASPVDNAKVELEIRPERGDVQNYVYKPIGNGVYSLTIPNRDTGGDQRLGNRLCFALARALNTLCSGAQALPASTFVVALCPALSFGALFLGVPPPIFLAACAIVVENLHALCSASDLGEDLCEISRIVSNRIARGRLSLNVTARIPGVASPMFDSLGTQVNGTYPPVTFVFPCQCQSGYGKRFLINDNNTEVKVTILPFEASFTDEIRLFYRGQSILIGTNRDVGRVVNLGRFNAGEELVFGIVVRETGRTFRMGPGARNPDRYAHARLDCLTDGAKVSFEDNFLGEGDRDFDDAVFRITTSH
jgi:hypothetical protein